MSLFRRREPLHERLAREGGLGDSPPPVDPGPHWGVTGIHGVARPREWDAVVSVEAPDLKGDTATFVALADGDLVDEDGAEGDLSPLADAVEAELPAPYRAQAVRKSESVWTVAARRVVVAALPDAPADEFTLVLNQGERTLTVDGSPAFGSVPELERMAAGRDVVIEASRVDGELFELKVSPL